MGKSAELYKRINGPIIALAGLALLLRVWDLDIKPPHFDEGINGHFVAQMWRDGFYRYDPTNFHGPLYFYVLQLGELIFGRGIVTFRFVTGLISTAIVVLVAMHRRFFGKSAYWAALIVALSPAFVFYSRYAIHESLFILLEVAFSYGFFLWREERSRLSATLMATGLFGMFAVKETFFIFFGTWAIAVYAVRFSERWFPVRAAAPALPPAPRKRAPATREDWYAIGLIGVLVTCALFSGFFMNLKGLSDMIAAYSFWTKTGVGSTGHEKEFGYWIELLWKYEWPGLLGLVISPFLFFFVTARERIIVLTGFGTWLAYSLIPYKTPWLNLNMLWLLAFNVGFLVTRIGELAKFPRFKKTARFLKPLVAPVALALVGVSAATMLRLNFRDFTNPKERYVYVQSTMDFKHAMDWIDERVRLHPEDLNMKIMVLSRDPWPMPWTLGEFPRLQYAKAPTADFTGADVILVDAGERDTLQSRLQGRYWVEPFQIRDSYDQGFAYFQFDKFKGIVPSSSEIFEGAPVNPTPEPAAPGDVAPGGSSGGAR